MERDPDGQIAALMKYTRSLHDVQELLGEAVVEAELCETVYGLARRLPDVEVVPELSDQLGRVGRGLARVERAERIELVFAADCSELLGYQWFLSAPQSFAPAGTLHSWSAFLERAVVERLPNGVPPIPRLPCEPPASGRGFSIRPGFSVMTGYVSDALAQLVKLREQGVISDIEYESAKTYLPEGA